MKRVITLIAFVFCLPAFSQIELIEQEVIDDNGNIEKVAFIKTNDLLNLLDAIVNLEKKVEELSNEIKGKQRTEWEDMLLHLEFFSQSKFNQEYPEKEIVRIARDSGEDLPSFMLTTKGKKSQKIEYLKTLINQ